MTTALPDHETCYRAVSGRDGRFDGWIYVGVSSTGIYCRPSCPAVTPKQAHCTFYATAGAAQSAGFRACRRCRPDAVPGSPLWSTGTDVTARAMRLIGDGVVDREGVAGLARRLGYSERQLHRVMLDHAGASPVTLARAQRAHAARILLESTTMAITDIAFAAGFGSVRQFNDTIREVFARTPREVRDQARRSDRAGTGAGASAGVVSVRLPTRAPIAWPLLLAHFARHAVPGIEASVTDGHAFSVDLPRGPAVAIVRTVAGDVRADLALTDWRDLAALLARLRRMFDLDADSVAIDHALGVDPVLAPLVAARAGVRLPGSIDAHEQALRTVVGQQVSIAGATTTWTKLVDRVSAPLPPALVETAQGWGVSLTHRPPTAEAIAALPPNDLPMPGARARSLVTLAGALASGDIDLGPGCDRHRARADLEALPGIGPWSSGHVAMRALGDPDVDLVATDLVARNAAVALGLDPRRDIDRFAPWRSYLTQHLWIEALAQRRPATRPTTTPEEI